MTDDEIRHAARALAQAGPEEILRWAAARFPDRVAFGTGFGVEGCLLIDLIGRHRLPIDVFTLDTSLLFPETVALWRRLESRYGLAIRAIRPAATLTQQSRAEGPRLWERDPDRCCLLRKLRPLEQALAGCDAWISAIRRGQTRDRTTAEVVEPDSRSHRVKLNPLLTWGAEDVWRWVRTQGVPYNPLHDEGYPSIGCAPCTTPVLPGEDPRAGRWRGREKTECGLHSRRPAATAAATEPLAPDSRS